MKDTRTPAEVQAANRAIFMERGPGLWKDYRAFVVGRDRKRRLVLEGGLGGMGCGEAWGRDAEPWARDAAGYDDAPEVAYEGNDPFLLSFAAEPGEAPRG